jgi:hypothetical protein
MIMATIYTLSGQNHAQNGFARPEILRRQTDTGNSSTQPMNGSSGEKQPAGRALASVTGAGFRVEAVTRMRYCPIVVNTHFRKS